MYGMRMMTCMNTGIKGGGVSSMQGKYVMLCPGREETGKKSKKRMDEDSRPGCGQRKRKAGKRAGAVRKGNLSIIRGIRGTLFCLFFLCMLTGFGMMIRASSRPKEQLWKYYTTVHTGYDYDLEDIVRDNMDESVYSSADEYIREVCEINSLPYVKGSIPDLRPGSMIVIPYHSAELK